MSLEQKQSEPVRANAETQQRQEKNLSGWAKKLEQLAQAGVKRAIAKHQADGQPIYYEHESKPGAIVMELPDGRRFEVDLEDRPPGAS